MSRFRCLLPALLTITHLGAVSPASWGAAEDSERLFQLDRVLGIQIDIPQASWEALRFQHPDLAAAKADRPLPRAYTFFRGSVSIDGTRISPVGIRKKGFIGSVTSQNPSLKIDLSEYVKGLKFSGVKDMTLNNNLQDPSCMHQVLTYYLFRKAGVPAPRCNFALVTVNGVKLGLYSHVEPIKKAFLARYFADPGGNLYEGRRSDLKRGWLKTFEKKTNEKRSDTSDLQAVADALESSDDALLESVGRLVDLDAFYRFWAMEVLLGHWDGYAENLNNYYLYRDPTSKKFHFIPWGTDEAFGDKNLFLKYKPPASVRAVGYLCRRLYNHPPSQRRYRETLRTLLDEVWKEEELLQLVDRLDPLVTPHLTDAQALHQDWVEKIKHFIRTRRQVLEAELDQPAKAWEFPVGFQPGFNLEAPSGFVKATFRTVWKAKPERLNPFAGSTATLEVQRDDKPTELLLIGAAAQPFPEAVRYGYPNIVIGGFQRANGRLLAASVTVDPDRFHVGELPIDMFAVMGAVIDVNPLLGDVKIVGFLTGTLKLDQVSRQPGQLVSGTLEANIHSE